jgi:hypothetical protein
MKKKTMATMSVVGLLLAGCGQSAPDSSPSGSGQDRTSDSAATQMRVDAIKAHLPELARRRATEFSNDSKTVRVGAFLTVSCQDPPKVDPIVTSSVMLGDCSYTFQNGSKETTFKGFTRGDVILPGEEDPTQPGNANATRLVILSVTIESFHVSSGVTPRLQSPISLGDADALQAFAAGLAQASDPAPIGGSGALIDGSSFDAIFDAGCGEGADVPASLAPDTRYYCFSFTESDNQFPLNGELLIGFETDGGDAIGVRALNISGSD